ncbi:Gephyrin [Oopsacas minuta]|uniref:Gephyrin n=1 Tax=Oopsacas minuta TaxID=111878 RepID=A0AAV7JAL4_9METZ|nr:Gephyrin [Oopsacas minuta]
MTLSSPLVAGVLTVSDSCFAGNKSDKSGDILEDLIRSSLPQFGVVIRVLVPDEQNLISSQLKNWCDKDKLDLVITTGGTGLTSRDVTPDATRSVLHRELPHLSTVMLIEGLKHTPYAALSRQICGNRGKTLVLNFPGSSSAVKECFSAVLPIIGHSINLLNDEHQEINKLHEPVIEDKLKITELKQYPMVSVGEALHHITDQSAPLSNQTVSLESTLNRTLGSDIHALSNIPPFPASVKDGYAIRSCDKAVTREVIGDCIAGCKPEIELCRDTVAYITTGAYLPKGADSVVMIEYTKLIEKDGKRFITLLSIPEKGQDVREPGTDMRKGELVLERGCLIGPMEIGILAAAGAREVSIFSLPCVGVFSTGDEIQDISQVDARSPYGVIDTNRVTLIAMLRNDGYDVRDMGIVKDDPNELRSVMLRALACCDVIISSGGMSMGNRDYVKPCLEAIGCKIWFGKVKVKPGKPTCFATLREGENRKYIFGLPGNPASAIVTYMLFVCRCLSVLSGKKGKCNPEIPVIISNNKELGDRTEYRRVFLTWEDGKLIASSTGGQQSSRILSMRNAQALLRIPAIDEYSGSRIDKGTVLKAILITRWISS